ncbi:hypothetical protein CHS0354_019304 [Potamilus streckersoni]|uniref:Uncharacterized protein n=1 Tax=Potamilus streckersoni TaxID=2493646 RepID=A0AAE0VW05_9BIVA|nr:hypothetical protein CHS0354_019304 [Potamilus streckersoni]
MDQRYYGFSYCNLIKIKVAKARGGILMTYEVLRVEGAVVKEAVTQKIASFPTWGILAINKALQTHNGVLSNNAAKTNETKSGIDVLKNDSQMMQRASNQIPNLWSSREKTHRCSPGDRQFTRKDPQPKNSASVRLSVGANLDEKMKTLFLKQSIMIASILYRRRMRVWHNAVSSSEKKTGPGGAKERIKEYLELLA